MVIKKFDKILDTVNGLSKIIPGIFKDIKGNLSSKRTFKLLGGGYLMIQGVDLLSRAEVIASPEFIGGCICVIASVFAAKILKTSENIKE